MHHTPYPTRSLYGIQQLSRVRCTWIVPDTSVGDQTATVINKRSSACWRDSLGNSLQRSQIPDHRARGERSPGKFDSSSPVQEVIRRTRHEVDESSQRP
jgi:hypothetical protein